MKRAEDRFLEVQVLEPKPNKMFSEFQHQVTRFLRYNKAVPCAECGKRRRVLWTQLVEFEALTMAPLVPIRSGLLHPPLIGVCTNHLLRVWMPGVPAWDEAERKKKQSA